MKLNWLLIFIPVAIVLDWLKVDPIVRFAVSALAIVPLAGLMGDATEALAEYLGPTLGGYSTRRWAMHPRSSSASSRFNKGLIGIVKSSLTGSIIGNLLLGLGLSMFVGGLKVKTQKFDPRVARINGALAGARCVRPDRSGDLRHDPERGRRLRHRSCRLKSAVILFLVYLASLVFTLVTHKAVVGKAGVKAEKKEVGE